MNASAKCSPRRGAERGPLRSLRIQGLAPDELLQGEVQFDGDDNRNRLPLEGTRPESPLSHRLHGLVIEPELWHRAVENDINAAQKLRLLDMWVSLA